MNIAIRNKKEYQDLKSHFNKLSLKIKNKRISLKWKIKKLIKKYPEFIQYDNIILNNLDHTAKFIFKHCSKILNCKFDGRKINDTFEYINAVKEYNLIRSKFEKTRTNVRKTISSMLKSAYSSKTPYKNKMVTCLKIKKLFLSLNKNVSEFIDKIIQKFFIDFFGKEKSKILINDKNFYNILIIQLSKPA